MSTSAVRIATLLITGVAIGVTAGAVVVSTLPVWLGIGVIIAVSIAGIIGSSS